MLRRKGEIVTNYAVLNESDKPGTEIVVRRGNPPARGPTQALADP